MNHLAHFHLAAPSEGHIVGALLADYLRGPLSGQLPPAVEAGVRLHRRIDAYTDAHAEVRALRASFDAGARRLAGVVLDLYFDLFLARHWDRFHELELGAFSHGVYTVLEQHRALLPPAGQRHAERIVRHDLLRRYAEHAVVEGALERIGERLGMEQGMQRAIDGARVRLVAIEAGFLVFYPQLIEMARTCEFSAGSGSS